jgi:hypothetical protein
METKRREMEFRRSKTIELSSQGYSEREIAAILKVNDTAVHRDLVYLRKQAQENIHKQVHETIPEEYQKAMSSINQVLKFCWSIVYRTADKRTRLQALALIDEVTRHREELSADRPVISDCIKTLDARINRLNGNGKAQAIDVAARPHDASDMDTRQLEKPETKDNTVF